MRLPRPAVFWSHVTKTDGCWIWTAAKDPRGYGRVGHMHGRCMFAHRAAWQLENGAIPAGLFVLHHCDTPACVRPAHLFLGTHQDNMDDMVAKGRGATTGDRNPAAKLSEAQVREMRTRYSSGRSVTLAEIATEFNVSVPAVHAVIHRRSWAHVE